MYNISQELKDKLNSNAIISTARLTFSNPHFVIDGSNLVSVKIKDYCYNEGRIIGTNIAKDVEIIIQNDNYNLQDKEFFLEIGVLLDNGEYEYIPYGYYIIDTVGDTKSNNQYKITAMDYMIKLNPDFIEFDASEYPMTMRQFLNKFAKQCGIELAEQTLPNETLVIPSMPYFTKTSRRTVLKQIAEVFGRFAKFNRLGQLEFRLKNEINEKINRSNMNSKLEIDKLYGEVNVVSILLSDDVSGENVTLRDEESIAIYGENIIKIVGNEFLSTAELREKAIVELFNDLKGFKYVPTSFKYMGKPYLDCGDTILVQDMDTDKYYESIVLNNYIEVPALRQSKMENLALTKTQVDNQYVLPLEERVSKTEFNVNKVDKKISLVVEEQTTQSNRITNVEKETNTVANNLNTFINETYAGDISNLQDQIDGAIQFWNGEAIPTLSNYPASEWTTEEQRNNHRADIYTVIQDIDGEMKQGKSYRFDKVGTTWQWVELTDNELSAVQALANSKAKVYVTTPTVPYNVGDLWLKDKELYECIKSKDASGSYSASDWVKATKYTDDTKANEVDEKLTTTNEKVSEIEVNVNGITERVESNETGIQENTQNIAQLENKILLTDTFERQKDFQINAAENILTDVKVYGELEQDTKVSSNILKSFSAGETSYFMALANVYTSNTNYYKAEPLADSWIHVECDLTGLTSGQKYIYHYIPPNKIPKLKANTQYTIVYEFRNVDITTMSGNLNTLNTYAGSGDSDNFFSGNQTINSDAMKKYNNSMFKSRWYTMTTLYGDVAMRNFHTINAGDKFSYDYRISVIEGDYSNIDYTYEEYANRPSPDEEARINTAGDVLNLFDNSVGGNAGEYLNINGEVATGNANLRYTDYIKVPFDTKNLAISGMTTSLQAPAICFYDKDKKFISGVAYESYITKIVDVPKDTYFFRTSYRTINTKFQIEKGVIIHDYIEPNTRGINYKNIGKNSLPSLNVTRIINGVTFTKNSDGSITVNGTATANATYPININAERNKATINLLDNTKYYMSSGVIGSSSTYYMQVFYTKNGSGPFYTSINSSIIQPGTNIVAGAYITVISGATVNNVTFYPQLETDGYTEYEPHKEYNETITLPENEFMGKIDTYEDYIEGNILHKRIGKFILDGTENWKITRNANSILYFFYPLNEKVLIRNSKCNYLKEDLNLYYSDGSISIYNIGSNLQNINILLNDTTINTVDLFKNYLAEQYANGTPVEIYYVLAEEYTRQIDRYTLPTMKGINNISVSAPLSATYYTNVDINSALTSKAEYAEQVIKVDEISTRVSSTETTVANQSADISNINDNIGSLNNSVNANQQEITVIKEDYTDLKQTVDGFDFTIVDKIQQQIANGEITSNVVKTTTVAIDADGIKVAKSGSEMQSLLDNEGFYVNKGNIDKTETKNNILTVDKDGVVTENLYVRTYLTAGYHRTEGYIENGKKRTGVFYQGGVND